MKLRQFYRGSNENVFLLLRQKVSTAESDQEKAVSSLGRVRPSSLWTYVGFPAFLLTPTGETHYA